MSTRIVLIAALLLSTNARAADFDIATASCASPEVENYIMDTLPTLYALPSGKSFAADHTVERIIFATNVRQSAVRLSCRLTVRLAYKGTTLPTQGFFIMDRMPNGKLRPTWMSSK